MASGIVLLVLLLSGPTGAPGVPSESSSATVRLDVRAGQGCTLRTDLAARVASRTPRVRFAEAEDAFVAKVVFTVSRTGGAVGELRLTDKTGQTITRRLQARSCDEAADAVALILAVTLDPSSAQGDRPSKAPDERASSPADSPKSASQATPGKSVPKPEDRPTPPSPEPSPKPTPSPLVSAAAPAEEILSHRRAGITLAGQTLWGPAPAMMPGISFYALAALDRSGWWSPALVLGVTHAWRGGLNQKGGTASFTLDAASLDACIVRLRLSVVEARPCVSALVGRLAASGSKTTAASSASRPFAMAGGAAVLTAGLGSMLELSLRLAIGATLIRDSYEFQPTVFHRAASVTTQASLGIGMVWR